LVVRKTNTTTIVQVVNAGVKGDYTVASATSTELEAFGWQGATGNIPAAYLTGLLAGLRTKSSGVDNVILDIGLHPPVNGSKIYAALKGTLDAGIEVPHNPEVIPDEERLSGVHIVEAYKHFKDKKNENHMFSKLEEEKIKIKTIPKQFENVKQKLLGMPEKDLKKKSATKTKPKKSKKKPKRAKPKRKAPRATPSKPKAKKLKTRGKKSKKSKKKK
jgi:large subunit ribosomal protein L18